MKDSSNPNAYDYFKDTFEQTPSLTEIADKLRKEAQHRISPLNEEWKSLLS